jgi:hypothetical protein
VGSPARSPSECAGMSTKILWSYCCGRFATFDLRGEDRLPSTTIVEHLNLLPHGLWSDWRGKNNTDTPRPMTQGVMAKLLAPFGIKPATIWPLRRNADTKSSRGYHRHQFEDAWARYCPPEGDTPTHSNENKRLRSG